MVDISTPLIISKVSEEDMLLSVKWSKVSWSVMAMKSNPAFRDKSLRELIECSPSE